MFFVLGKLQKDIIIFGSIVDGFPVLSILCYFELLHNSKLTPAQNTFIIKKKKNSRKVKVNKEIILNFKIKLTNTHFNYNEIKNVLKH